jgi:ketopantoate reductase
MGEVWADESLRALTVAATREGVAIAAAAGVAIAPGAIDRACEFFGQVGAHRPSVLRDDGELPHVLGHILAAARRHGVSAPALGSIQERVSRRAALAAGGAPA